MQGTSSQICSTEEKFSKHSIVNVPLSHNCFKLYRGRKNRMHYYGEKNANSEVTNDVPNYLTSLTYSNTEESF